LDLAKSLDLGGESFVAGDEFLEELIDLFDLFFQVLDDPFGLGAEHGKAEGVGAVFFLDEQIQKLGAALAQFG